MWKFLISTPIVDYITGQMEERMTLCNMVIEAGGKNSVVPADGTTHKFLEVRAVHEIWFRTWWQQNLRLGFGFIFMLIVGIWNECVLFFFSAQDKASMAYEPVYGDENARYFSDWMIASDNFLLIYSQVYLIMVMLCYFIHFLFIFFYILTVNPKKLLLFFNSTSSDGHEFSPSERRSSVVRQILNSWKFNKWPINADIHQKAQWQTIVLRLAVSN